MTHRDENRIIARAVLVLLVAIALAYVAYLVRGVLLTLYVGSLLAIGLSPAVRWLERLRIAKFHARLPRWLAILALYLAALTVVFLLLALMVPPVVAQGRQLAAALPGYIDQAQQALAARGLARQQWSWSDLFTSVQFPGAAITSLFGLVQGTLGVVGKLLTIFILPFYLLLEADSLRAGLLTMVSEGNRQRVDQIMQSVTVKVGAWLGGQLLLGVVIGASATLGFWLIGVPYFYVLGLIAAFGEMIPVLGPILAAVPAILLGLTVSPQTALFVLIYSWVQQVVENNVLVPRIMQRQVGVSPVTVIVALLIGSELLGIAGAILAVPTAGIVQVIAQERVAHASNSGN